MTQLRATRPLGLLLSDEVDLRAGDRIDRIARDAGVSIRRHTATRAPADLTEIQIAFFSRDLYEGSTLRTPGLRSNAFFRLADAAPELKWLHVCSSGLDLPQYAQSLARGVRVTPSTGVTATPIAQTVLAAILAHSRGFPHWLAAQSQRRWAPLSGAARPPEIENQRVVVVGAGAIGKEICRLLKAVGFHVTGVRRSATPTPPFDDVIDFSQIDEALPSCDWLVLAVPLTSQTHGLIDRRRLGLLSPHARLVNVARGELIEEAALIHALKSGGLSGAYLDTFMEEPLPEHSPLWDLPNTWISPHNSAASQGHEGRVVDCFLEYFKDWIRRI